MFNIDSLKQIFGDLVKMDVEEPEVPTIEAAFQRAGASIVEKFKQENGLFTVLGIKPDNQLFSSHSTRDISSQRQTVDKAMTSGR